VLSVLVPTRNRAALWRSAWLLDSLRAQTEPPDELVIALDHTEDRTLELITADLSHDPAPFPVRILEVLAPQATPHPASGIPDNCLFHAAAGDVILHVDDDISLPPDFCRRTRVLFTGLPSAILWAQHSFVDDHKTPLPGNDGRDCRAWLAEKHRWPLLPGGITELPKQQQLHWGAVWTATARDLRRIGGHNLAHCGWHNTDTRLGKRLIRTLHASYVTSTPEMTVLHQGKTWHAQNCHNPAVIRAAQGTTGGPRIANGGPDFWKSTWFDSAYVLTTTIPGTTMQLACGPRPVGLVRPHAQLNPTTSPGRTARTLLPTRRPK